jgi:hypothetical protein
VRKNWTKTRINFEQMKQKSDETRAQGVFRVAKVGLNSWESQK